MRVPRRSFALAFILPLAAIAAPSDAELIKMREFLEHLELLENLDVLENFDQAVEQAAAATNTTTRKNAKDVGHEEIKQKK